jgi:ABC-type Fe3+-hydroxamate transport system substrate-binding protein
MKDWADVEHPSCVGTPRIACLVPSITELLFSLGLGAHVVARTGFCIHPREGVAHVAKVGGTKDVNVKKLLGLAPTHVIVNIDENRVALLDQLAAAGPPQAPRVIVTHPVAPVDNIRLYGLLGSIFNCQHAADTLIHAFQDALTAAQLATRDLPREPVLYIIWKEPWMTVSADTYIARTLATLGWDCIAPDSSTVRYPTLAETDGVWHTVHRVFLSSEPYAFTADDAKAVQTLAPQAAVGVMDGEATSWYGSRAIAGLRTLQSLRLQLVKST